MSMKIIFAGGGTAGHINPAIAIANYIRQKQPDTEILFIGTEGGLEKTLVPKAGFEIQFIKAQGFRRKLSFENVVAVVKAANSFRKCRKIIKKFRPDIVIGTGGYVSGPMLAAAAKMKVPTLIHEQNVFAGVTSRMLSGMVDVVCISFEESRKAFDKAKKIVHTGNPIRPELFNYSKQAARKKLGVGDKPFILAFGGSLGAEKLNEAVLDFLDCARNDGNFELLFGTGETRYEDVMRRYKKKPPMPNVKIVPYIHNMQEVMAAADFVIGRAGAITLSELNALGKPSLLIPSPNVTDNHQEHNARALEKAGAAIVVTEPMLEDKQLLYKKLKKVLADKTKLDAMAEKSLAMGIQDGTAKIYKEVKKLVINKG